MNKISKVLILLILVTVSAGIASAESIIVGYNHDVEGMRITSCSTGGSAPDSVDIRLPSGENHRYYLNDIVLNQWKVIEICPSGAYQITLERTAWIPTPTSTAQPALSTPGASIISNILAWLKSIFSFLPW